MSYHIYTTTGIILKRTPLGEADVLVHILTEDFGLIMGSARSARLSVSKLRPALQEYALVSISCIKGKNGWKITNVVDRGNYYFENPQFTHRVMSQVLSIILKMITGESPNKEVFQIVKTGFDSLSLLNTETISDFEILIVIRILNELGYVSKNGETRLFLEDHNVWSEEILKSVSENRKNLVSTINKALKESQL